MGENYPFLLVTSRFMMVFDLNKIWQFWQNDQMQNMIFHFCFWNVKHKKFSSFAPWTQKLPGIGSLGEARKFNVEISKNIDTHP